MLDDLRTLIIFDEDSTLESLLDETLAPPTEFEELEEDDFSDLLAELER